MEDIVVRVATSISTTIFEEELRSGINQYNEEKSEGEPAIDPSTLELSRSHGFTGAEIAIFFSGAIASGITYDVCKHIVAVHIIPRLNARFGGGAAKIEKGE